MGKRVFLGVGHGGSDPGAVGLLTEKEVNLTVALEVRRILERSGVTVGISREGDGESGLAEKIRKANDFRPDLAVEIHSNSGGGDGFEAYVQTNAYGGKSRAAAETIEKRVKAAGQNSRGIKTRKNSAGTADYFGWLREVKAPAVLLEGFFVDGPEAVRYRSPAAQRALGAAYARGILDYLEVKEVKDMPVYQTLAEVPQWGKEAVSVLMEKGALRGGGDGKLELSEDLLRMIVILHRLGLY